MSSGVMIKFLNEDTLENEIFRLMDNKNRVRIPDYLLKELANIYGYDIKEVNKIINKFIKEDMCIRLDKDTLFFNPHCMIRRRWVKKGELIKEYDRLKNVEYVKCPERTYNRDSL